MRAITGVTLPRFEQRYDVARERVGGGGLLLSRPRPEHGAVDAQALEHGGADIELGARAGL